VLVVTVIAAWLTWPGPRSEAITTDGIWAFLFAATWRFAAENTDYFAATSPLSPLQHYWSLSVEEQFYFV
jgi:peptidoglycan/LPS O-acetylase OafA/YrhL